MSASRAVARSFFDKLCSGDFAGGFASPSDDATWTIIGDIPLSEHTVAVETALVGRKLVAAAQ